MGKRLTKQIPLYLNSDTITRLEALRRRRGCTMQDLLRQAIDAELRAAEADGMVVGPPPAALTSRATSTEPRRFTISEILTRLASRSPPGTKRTPPWPG